MKKRFLSLFLLLCAFACTYAASFGILINGKTYYAGTKNEQAQDPSFQEYMALGVPVKAGDQLQLCDKEEAATWVVALDNASVAGISLSGEHYVCSTAGCYNFYIKLKFGADQLYIGAAEGDCSGNAGEPYGGDNPNPNPDPNPNPNPDPSYAGSVPDACTDVILQAFYWDSYKSGAHGDTKWTTLMGQTSEINAYFDYVWLPPSAKSSGGVGYLPAQYSNQNSAWGTRADLEKLIAAFHAGNTRVIADMVVNHAANVSNWCDFYENNFGEYGTFAPDASWICKTDEMNSDSKAGSCRGRATGAADDGYGDEANYGAARDWDHDSEDVRAMFRAYAKWMKNEMGYDGFRYDYCKGFHNSHVSDYNSAAQIGFSVMEYWDGNANTLWNRICDANKNTLTFDFATKYTAFNNSLAAGNYSGMKGCGLLGAGHSKYAVTFVDNHDSYQRDNNEFCGKGNSMSAANKAKTIQANAFILSMPGVPCVFYPHWKEFKAEIQPMILARKAVGVHSESPVKDEGDAGGYRATVTGKNGMLIVEFGNKVSASQAGYTKAASGTGYAIWTKVTQDVAPVLVIDPGTCTYKTESLSITMKAIGGSGTATIYYTLDSTDPRSSSTRKTYSAPITIKGTVTLKAYAATAKAQTDVQEQTYTYKAPQTRPITVKFYKPAAWKILNLYAWVEGEKAATELLGKWPGTEITVQDSEGFYYYQFDESIKEVNFIFSNKVGDVGEKTSDLWTDEDVCYGWASGAEVLLEDCNAPTAVENTQEDIPTLDPTQPMYNVLGQPVSADYQGVIIQNAHKYMH